MVPITVHAGVMSVIERGEDAVLDQGTDAVVPEFIVEGFRVVAPISGETSQVARESWHAAYDDFLGEKAVDEVVDEWYDIDELSNAAEQDEHIFVVAEPDDISGFVHVVFNAERDVWMLIRIYVLPDRWGDGIGTTLLEDVETELEDRDVSTYELAVLAENDVGVSFYESRGFERVETAETELAGVETTEYWYQKTL